LLMRYIREVISRGTRENGVAIFSVKERIMASIAIHFPAKNEARLQDFAYTVSKFSAGRYPPTPVGAWTQTPIFAWLASVPTVPVLRNDYILSVY